MTIYEKISKGVYSAAQNYPDRPIKPEILRRKVGELTDNELSKIAQLREEYRVAEEKYSEALAAYRQKENELLNQFRIDLLADNGMADDSQFGNEMYRLAWAEGHSGGLYEVVNYFTDLLPLYHLYVAKD